MIKILSIIIFFSAVLAIFFNYTENNKYYAIFKPLTTLLIIILSVVIYQRQHNIYSLLISIALLFALAGDIFLINEKLFLYGLASFLIAHILFIIGFTQGFGFQRQYISLVILSFFAIIYFFFLKDYLHDYKIPVAIYMSVIILMNWQAVGLLSTKQSEIFWIIAIGSLLFTLSDSLLAYNKFVRNFYSSQVAILSTYWLAIYLFTIAGFYLKGTK